MQLHQQQMTSDQASNQSAIHALGAFARSKNVWTVNRLKVKVWADLATETDADEINLVDHLSVNHRFSKRAVGAEDLLWLDPDIKTNSDDDRHRCIRMVFSDACHQAGFREIFDGKAQESMDGLVVSYRIACSRSRYYEEHKYMPNEQVMVAKGTKRKCLHTSGRPIPGRDDKCPCFFRVYFHTQIKRWFLFRQNPGCLDHVGHPQLSPERIRSSIKELAPETMQQLSERLSKEFPLDCLRSILNEEKGINVTQDQIRHVRRTIDAHQTTSRGDRILDQLNGNPMLNHTALLASCEMSGYYIRTQTKGRPPKALEGEAVPSTTEAANKIFQALSLRNGQEFLLMVAWIHQDGLRLISKSPEVMGFDVTLGNNSEKRPLLRGTVLTRNRKAIPFFECFMPGETRWAFHWVFHHALPELVPAEILCRVRMILTDEDSNCYTQIDSARLRGVFAAALHRLCAWHKIDRNYTKMFCSRMEERSKVMVHVLHAWFLSLTDNVYNDREWDASIELLHTFIDSHVDERLRVHTRNFIVTRLNPVKDKFAFYYFMVLSGGGTRTTSFTEGENGVLKRGLGRVQANMGIDRSQKCISLITGQRYEKLEDELTQRYIRSSVTGTESERLVRDMLEPVPAKALLREHKLHTLFTHIEREPGRWLVRQHKWRPIDVVDIKACVDLGRLISYVVPRIDRTYEVSSIVSPSGETVLECTCHMYDREGIVCRHIYCVLDVDVDPNMCKVDCRQDFMMFFNEDGFDEYTAQAKELMSKEWRGPVYCPSMRVRKPTVEKQLDFFLEAQASVLLQPGQFFSGQTNNIVDDGYPMPDDNSDSVPEAGSVDEGIVDDGVATGNRSESLEHLRAIAYQLFVQCSNNCRTTDDCEELAERLAEHNASLLARHRHLMDSTAAVATFPNIDTRRDTSRYRPSQSPTRCRRYK